MYEVINEELGIKACNLGDLTAKQVNRFLGQWEEGATIATLTLFFDQETGSIVLNKDNEQYEFYVMLAENYLVASEEKRVELKEKVPESIKETIKVIENCLEVRKINKELFILDEQGIIEEKYEMPIGLAAAIEKKFSFSNPRFWMYKAFRYGVIQGKRMEREKKRKRQSVNA